MRIVVWIYALVVFSSESWSLEPGTYEITSVKPNTTSQSPKVYVNRQEVVNLGSSVNLTCGDKTWTETLYVIWKLKLKHKTCRILIDNYGQYIDECHDGKSLRNNTIGQSYLHILKVSADDVGLYQCEIVYKAGNENYNISVAVIVPPSLSAWLEPRYNKLAAVCRAEGGSPAANISWSLTGISESVKTSGSDGFLTVQSDLELPGDMNPENLSCIVRHQFWDQEKILVPELRKPGFKPLQIIIPVTVVTIVLLVGFTVLALKKVLGRCQLSDTPTKPPPMEDVEEVEPYASYVQRVNSIYN